MEFTFDAYVDLLDTLVEADRTFCGYDESIDCGDVLLRHDVDWSPRNALKMARLEAERGISATYFFLLTTPMYNLFHKPNRLLVDRIEALGHDVGLHFSTHQYWSGEPPEDELVDAVESERETLAHLGVDPVDIVAFHRPPEWVLKRSFDGIRSTYAEKFFTEITYRGDSNQRWRDEHPLADGIPEKMQILSHPGLWGERDRSFETRLTQQEDFQLGRAREFLDEQFVDKKYNVDEYCEFVFEGASADKRGLDEFADSPPNPL